MAHSAMANLYFCVHQASSWVGTSDNHISTYSCSSGCASVVQDATGLDTSTAYVLFVLSPGDPSKRQSGDAIKGMRCEIFSLKMTR
jgi:hypothetical protein